MKKYKIKHIRSGNEEVVSEEAWNKIIQNGFQSDFTLLGEVSAPKEVKDHIADQPADVKGKPASN